MKTYLVYTKDGTTQQRVHASYVVIQDGVATFRTGFSPGVSVVAAFKEWVWFREEEYK